MERYLVQHNSFRNPIFYFDIVVGVYLDCAHSYSKRYISQTFLNGKNRNFIQEISPKHMLSLLYRESNSHVLIHCPFVWEVSYAIMKDFTMLWISPQDLLSLLISWRFIVFSVRGNLIWRLVPAAVIWSLLMEHNSHVFQDNAEPSFRVYRRVKDLVIFLEVKCEGCK